ncbi:6424_t:CDS:2 [Ambispora gerdemannii]|uniref:6424_t:CDS:1 n=1 Tax=Ambispora gerdemannii TaxID=144530 RepID=A0A9N8WQH1_9GLOM|nr:6424_t:CDS:2 [Ambispora gerdemannii]
MSKFTRNLIKDLAELLENSDEYNITITAGENENAKKFQGHSLILRARCPYFRRTLSKDWAKKEGEMMVFKKPNISPIVFKLILKYLFTSEIDLNEESGDDVLNLLVAADELEIHELIHHAQDNLISKKFTWIQQNLVKIMHTVSLHELFERLSEHSNKIINEEPHLILKASDFLSLKESVLVSLLKRDELAMDEIEIWNSMIKWGTGNTLNLGNQPVSKWTPQNFAALEKTLHQCIPLIRYSDISSNDYFKKVMPYRKIIPKDMKTEILGYHFTNSNPQPIKILPPRSGSINSKIIKFKHTNLISSWIDNIAIGNINYSESVTEKVIESFEETNIETVEEHIHADYTLYKGDKSNESHKSLYEFKLLYRGSRNDFEAKKFRELCGSQTGTVVVVRTNKSGKIIGGYNPGDWGGNVISRNVDSKKAIRGRNVNNYYNGYGGVSYLNAPGTFIFSLGDGSDLQSAKISRNNWGNQIAYNPYQADSGPYFYNDLYISDNCNKNESSWYQYCSYGTQDLWDEAYAGLRYIFKVDEYEVFQISKKHHVK